MSEANRGRGQPRRGYRRTKPATRSGAGRLWSRRAAGFLLHTFLSPPKEKCERPMGRPVPIRAGVGASGPAKGELLTAKLSIIAASRVAFRSPPCTPFGESAYPHRTGVCASGRVGGFPRGKQSAQPALPCVPLVVCLNSGSLTAFGGCIHWIPASLRSLPDPFGSPPEAIERPIGLQALPPRRGRRVRPRQGNCLRQSCFILLQAGGFPLAPCTPSGSRRVKPHRGRSPKTL